MKAQSVRMLGTRLIAVVLTLLVPCASWSQWTASTAAVTTVWSHAGYYFIQTNHPDTLCGTAGKFWWLANGSSDAKDMYAMALAAFLAGKRISVVQSASPPNCLNGGNVISHMSISD